MSKKKESFLGSCHDAIINVMKYDRRDDEELSAEDVEELFKSGQVSIDEMLAAFKGAIIEYQQQYFDRT